MCTRNSQVPYSLKVKVSRRLHLERTVHCLPLYTAFWNSAHEIFHLACLLAPSFSFSTPPRRPQLKGWRCKPLTNIESEHVMPEGFLAHFGRFQSYGLQDTLFYVLRFASCSLQCLVSHHDKHSRSPIGSAMLATHLLALTSVPLINTRMWHMSVIWPLTLLNLQCFQKKKQSNVTYVQSVNTLPGE